MSAKDSLAEIKEEWQTQLIDFVNTTEKLEEYINLTDEERSVLQANKTTWGTTPYFASLMDPDNPNCPIRKQVVPSRQEQENTYGMDNYLVWKENRDNDENRPDTIARQYKDRVAFTVTQNCGIYCRHCFRKELVVDGNLELDFNVEEGLYWISQHPEVRDVLITGGDPLLLPDEHIAYLIERLREMSHIEMIRFGSRVPIVLPQRITENLKKILGGYHNVPIWLNTQCNHPKELTHEVAWAVFELMSCGVNVGNQAVLLKGINDDVETFRELHQKLLKTRIRPYYVFYCEAAPGIDHFRTPVEKGAELIRDALRGHTTGLAQPMHVVATNIGKIPLMPDYYITEKDEKEYTLRNHKDEMTKIPNVPE
ncbi:MAG: KamA family radical SAM protein [Phycisphaerae bacterium]|nr:KamA family radical SAM protein [Gammaproteobacteria bacterium]NIR52291.1 KamA family radical SAM protein [candidate division KSB1 bacterium]NIV02426.1 KamA family radical SAM protein [Phycisphaerae bacterium]NIS27650.1 KamA family radical SAM protein [candidate division KSB1 bacterium]NIU28331.1 KamA family radical SAM protein [candidate division KSB1 bacterium]